jgi:hypothetical protein
MNIKTLNINEKKRLFTDLKNDEIERLKLDTYNIKYPGFKKKINCINLAINELKNNIIKNNEIIKDINFKITSRNSHNDIINDYNEHNKQIEETVNILKKQITEIKDEFEPFCIHTWITEFKYTQADNIQSNDKESYVNCSKDDFDDIKQTANNINTCNTYNKDHKIIDNIILENWKKKLVVKSLCNNDCYDRETYYLCENCDHHHTVNFYSK